MPASPDSSLSPELRQKVDDVLDRWEDAVARGEYPSVEDFCKDCPEVLETVREQVHALEQMRVVLESPTVSTWPPEQTRPDVVMTSRFRDLNLHASGGLGRVYLGTSTEVRRNVAIKFLQKRHRANQEIVRQFLAEAEITSRLDHPGVVPVFGLGESSTGECYYVMRFIQGEELDATITRFHGQTPVKARDFESMEFRDLLQRVISACKTIAYAHSRGIVHLDLKPKNIMLGRYGDTIVVDWGCAQYVSRTEEFRCDHEQSLRPEVSVGRSSHGSGTPAYMSPEQYDRNSPLTPATDIFNLGGTLYKLMTGRPPYVDGKRRAPAADAAQPYDFDLPRRVNPAIPRALEAVCLRAMAPRPAERYTTALELATDLERFLAGNPVSAHKECLRDRASRWLRRHRGVAASLLAGSALLAVGSMVAAHRFATVANSEATARKSVETLQAATLRTSARYAADLFAREIEGRWNILQLAATDRELLGRMKSLASEPKNPEYRARVQSWLDQVHQKYQGLNATSWFVVDAAGTQQAIYPRVGARTVGQKFSHRDYFHGRGRDFAPSDTETLPPIQSPHLSTPYISVNQKGSLRIALTVPIWDEDATGDKPIGVLGMTTEMGHFKMLANATLVDLRSDWLEGKDQRGLVLQHPHWETFRSPGGNGETRYPRVDEGVRTELEELVDSAEKSAGIAEADGELAQGAPQLWREVADYRDPLAKMGEKERRAVFYPVQIRIPGLAEATSNNLAFCIIMTEESQISAAGSDKR